MLIKRARKARGWTQQDLADQSDIGVRTLIRWENGEVTEPEARQVIIVADALKIPRADAFEALGWLPAAADAEPAGPSQLDRDIQAIMESNMDVAMKLRLIDHLRALEPPLDKQSEEDEKVHVLGEGTGGRGIA